MHGNRTERPRDSFGRQWSCIAKQKSATLERAACGNCSPSLSGESYGPSTAMRIYWTRWFRSEVDELKPIRPRWGGYAFYSFFRAFEIVNLDDLEN